MLNFLKIHRARIGKVAAAAAVVGVLTMSVAGTALADDRDWRRHEWEAHRWHRIHHHPVPGVVYAPPVVVTPPQPTYVVPQQPVYSEPPGINFVIPLHIH